MTRWPATTVWRMFCARGLKKLSCDFDLKDNYFAWQAFGRGYGKGADMPLPPYLQEANYETVKSRADRVNMRHANMTDMLAGSADASFDRLYLPRCAGLDDRCAADVIVDRSHAHGTSGRSGAVPHCGRAEPACRDACPMRCFAAGSYRADESLDFTARDRSAIYGGVHLVRPEGLKAMRAITGDHAGLMDEVYRGQRHIYDLTRKYYLLGP